SSAGTSRCPNLTRIRSRPQEDPETGQHDYGGHRNMNAEVGDSARLRTLGKPLKIRRRDPEDFDRIGQTKPEEGFSKTVVAPADHNQHGEDERRNRHADELKSE